MVAVSSCATNTIISDSSFSTRNDVALKAGEPMPFDGVGVSYERYLHLLICENDCED
jgi:hypothetical protein